MGRGSPGACSLLDKLRGAVHGGHVLCPISEGTFIELFKQRDQSTRRATAALMDELSKGVSLIDPERRTMTEVGHFIYQVATPRDLYELDEIVWGKVGYVLGPLHPVIEGLSPELQFRLQRECFDALWDLSLVSIAEKLGEELLPDSSFDDLAHRLNSGNVEHAADLKSFQDTYRAEARGAADLVGRAIAEAITEIGIKEGKLPSDTPPPSGEDPSLNTWKNLIAHALSADKGDTRLVLRSLHIHAALHAAHRWDKQRRFSGNDIPDLQHAAAGLAYCGAFFTENPLRSRIQQKHVALDRLYDCSVLSSLAEAEAYLDGLIQM